LIVDTGSEKRKLARSDFPQTIHLQLTAEQSGKLELLESISRGLDINSHGLGLVTDLSLQKGDVVKIRLPAQAEGTFLPVFSQVVWALKENSEYRVGLQFLT
jgi:hypothetical protein